MEFFSRRRYYTTIALPLSAKSEVVLRSVNFCDSIRKCKNRERPNVKNLNKFKICRVEQLLKIFG